jgi:PDZ domain-containing protein
MRESGRRWSLTARLGRAGAIFVLVAVFLAFNSLPTGYFAVYPGPVRSLQGVVTVDGKPAPRTSFYMVAVAAKEAGPYELLRAAVDPGIGVWSKREVYGDMTPEQYAAESKALMEKSQNTAAYLAFRASGFDVAPGEPPPLGFTVRSGEVLGPSAGLAFALEMVSSLTGKDLAGGRKIAATGVLDSEGRVAAVGGIAQKAIACREDGIDVFIVPAEDAPEASRNAGAMKVVGVRTLEEALGFLGGGDIP